MRLMAEAKAKADAQHRAKEEALRKKEEAERKREEQKKAQLEKDRLELIAAQEKLRYIGYQKPQYSRVCWNRGICI